MKITRSGLTAIGCSVGLLWGFLAAERVIVARAEAEQAAAIRTIEKLRLNKQPPPHRLAPGERARAQRLALG